uniref:C2H2-type domain-containing protein n=1 Tax=Timema genevievae TaxID=629358 RepID=A0A7R9PQ38_TIMGE|nr:unnamed protein product [Timema genevievae]
MANLAQTPMDPKPFQDDVRAESLIESLKYKQCPHCGKRFRFKRHFGKHLEGHKRHDCKLCDALLSSRQENARHMLERHHIVVASKSLFKCEYCPKKFVKRATLHNHYKKHLEGQDVCLVCGEFVKSAEQLKAHQNKHEQEKEWHCEQCEQWFARRQQYLIHMKGVPKVSIHREKRLYSVVFQNVLNLLAIMCQTQINALTPVLPNILQDVWHHMSPATKSTPVNPVEAIFQQSIGFSITREKSMAPIQWGDPITVDCVSCRLPDQVYYVITLLLIPPLPLFLYYLTIWLSDHVSVLFRSDDRDFVCFSFQTGFYYYIIMVIITTNTSTPIPKLCTACQLTFQTARSYSHHLNSPGHLKKASTDTVTCEKCNKSFRSQKVLSQHTQRVHLTTSVFQCDNCDYSTKCKANLARHNVAIHADRKEFICELCGTAFSTLNTLRDHHTYIHSEQRLFPCELCDKTFKRKSELNRHVKIHSDSRPVKCHCGQSYKCVSHLRRHEQKSHNVAKSKKGKKESSSIDRISSKQLNTSQDMSSGNVFNVQPLSSSLDGVTDLITLNELPMDTLSLSHDTSRYKSTPSSSDLLVQVPELEPLTLQATLRNPTPALPTMQLKDHPVAYLERDRMARLIITAAHIVARSTTKLRDSSSLDLSHKNPERMLHFKLMNISCSYPSNNPAGVF